MECVAKPLFDEVLKRVRFLIDVGLGYLTLSRETSSLSGGEVQRIRLAGQLGAGLTGVTYVLDEPTVGLHQRDTGRVIEMLKKLTKAGNTVVVVEHDPEMIRAADWPVRRAARLSVRVKSKTSALAKLPKRARI